MKKNSEINSFQDFYNRLCDEKYWMDEYKEGFEKYVVSKDPMIREDVAELLANFDCDFSRDLLHMLVKDKNWQVRYTALDSLGVVGKQESIDKLYSLFKTEKKDINIGILLFSITDIHIYNKYDKSEYIKKLYRFRYDYGTNPIVLPFILAQLILLGENVYYDELIELYQVDDNNLKFHILCAFENLLIEGDNLNDTIRNRIYLDVEDIATTNNEKIPRFKAMVQSILNLKNDDKN